MLLAYDPRSHKLVEGSAVGAPWLHVVEGTDLELSLLRTEVPASFLPHLRDHDELARIDRDGETRLVVVRVPRKRGELEDVPFSTSLIGVIVSGDRIVTVAPHPSEVIDSIAAREDLELESPQRFVLHVVLCAAEHFLDHVREMNREIAQLEDQLQASIRNQEVYGLLRYQKSLVHFSTALASNALMLERMGKDSAFELTGADRDLYEDAEVELRQAIEMTDVSRNILGSMMDAFASIISNNLNSVMKVLTSITIVLMFPTIIASLYGMNVELPLQKHPGAFLILIVLSVAVSVMIATIFVKKRWL